MRPGETPRVGVVTAEGVVDLAEVAPTLPRDMVGLIEAADLDMLDQVRRAAARGRPQALHSIKLLAPVPRPPEFIGVGLNYHDHVQEAGLALPDTPTVFNKQTSCIVGPSDDVLLPSVSGDLDYEGELGMVIGRGAGRNCSPAAARAAIFGYVVVNDFSIRDWQMKSPTVTLGKSFDTHGPFGPWIVTADEVTEPHALALTTRVNGELRQSGNTADMIFDCYALVGFLSRVMTLRPGTVVTTGTPAGVGFCKKPPNYLRAGDLVTVEIAGIGQLANRVVAEAEQGRA